MADSEQVQESPFLNRITTILLEAKDLLSNYNSFDLEIQKSLLTTKIVSRKRHGTSPFVFLLFPCCDCEQRMLEVVKAVLESVGKKVSTKETVNIQYVEDLISFIKSSNKILLLSDKNIIANSIAGDFRLFELENTDSVSVGALSRSLCILFAICGKTVSTSLDSVRMNDYGIIRSL